MNSDQKLVLQIGGVVLAFTLCALVIAGLLAVIKHYARESRREMGDTEEGRILSAEGVDYGACWEEGTERGMLCLLASTWVTVTDGVSERLEAAARRTDSVAPY